MRTEDFYVKLFRRRHHFLCLRCWRRRTGDAFARSAEVRPLIPRVSRTGMPPAHVVVVVVVDKEKPVGLFLKIHTTISLAPSYVCIHAFLDYEQ